MKKYLLNLIPFIITIGCVVTFNIIGSEVAPDGTLVEPFFLIPIGYLFLAISVITLLVNLVSHYRKTKKSNN